MGALANLVTAEIKADIFDAGRYLFYFPGGTRAAELHEANAGVGESPEDTVAAIPTVREHFKDWIARQVPPIVRVAQQADLRRHVVGYVLPAVLRDGSLLGDLNLTDVKASTWFQLRDRFRTLGLSDKTSKNILGSLRSLMRDARERYDEVTAQPPQMKWPRRPPTRPDPFSSEERQRIIAWFRAKKPHYHSFVLTLFHTGMRPSEATALRWGDVDLSRGTISITRSRYLGTENAPKTAGSERTIRVLSIVRDTLLGAMPLHARGEDYVFINELTREPIHQGEWGKEFWHRPLRALKIRPRKFYTTRHTFISVALTAGVNVKFLAEQCGTSVAMIERHYGRYLTDDADTQLRLLEAAERAATEGQKEAKVVTLGVGSPILVSNYPENRVVPRGFEPLRAETSPRDWTRLAGECRGSYRRAEIGGANDQGAIDRVGGVFEPMVVERHTVGLQGDQ